MNPNSVGKAFRVARLESGVTKAATVHTLRHSWATHLLEAGVPLPVIQQWMGHASLRSTMLYTHLTQRIEASALDKLSELLAGLL
jgi:site-specific recombinase XerD